MRNRKSILLQRGVAQPGSAPGLGPGGRRFESCRPDLRADNILKGCCPLFVCVSVMLSCPCLPSFVSVWFVDDGRRTCVWRPTENPYGSRHTRVRRPPCYGHNGVKRRGSLPVGCSSEACRVVVHDKFPDFCLYLGGVFVFKAAGNSALMDIENFVADVSQSRDNMRRNDDELAPSAHVVQPFLEQYTAFEVKAVERFVQNIDVVVLQHQDEEHQPFLHSHRIPAGILLQGEAEFAVQPVYSGFVYRFVSGFQAEFHELFCGHQRVEVGRVVQVSHACSVVETDRSFMFFQPAHASEQRAFSGTVLSHNAINPAFREVKTDI